MPAVKLHLFGKTKILIVEDNSALQKVLRDHLTGEGYEILQAETGQRGLEMALAEHPDLILQDLMLPDRDGISVLRELRRDLWGGAVKVIILSNIMPGTSILSEARDLHISGFMEKANLSLDAISVYVREALTAAEKK